jgi:inosose dehydratase
MPDPGPRRPAAPAHPRSTAGAAEPSERRRLHRSPIGVVPITWNNVDFADLAPEVPAATVLDACAALGFEGVQLGRGFPLGADLRAALTARGLRLAEVYAELPVTADGPSDDALAIGRERLGLLRDGGGEVLVAACRIGGGREGWAGRGANPGAPRLDDDGWARLAAIVEDLAADAASTGHVLAFHPHAGTFVETPDEIRRLFALTDPVRVGACLDVGHVTVGGGDPVALAAALGRRVRHIHAKDVDGAVLDDLRSGRLPDFAAAIRARIFTELGRGIVDLDAVVAALDEGGYEGWLMLEQDSSWLEPAAAIATGHAALLEALGR